MVQTYRQEGIERFGKEFYSKNDGAPFEVIGRTLSNPTFWEFVQVGLTHFNFQSVFRNKTVKIHSRTLF